jgi:hypothetical protein
MIDLYDIKAKAKISRSYSNEDTMIGVIDCNFCGQRDTMPVIIEAGTFTLPIGWHFVYNSEEHTARVMCDKCFNKLD